MKPPDKSKFQAIAHEAEAEDTYQVVNVLRSDLKNIRYEIVLMMDKAGDENINSIGEMYGH